MSELVHLQFFLTLMVLLNLSLVACSSDSKPTTPSPTVAPPAVAKPIQATNEAQVKSIIIRMLESFPVQVNVVVTGELPNSCTTLDQFLQDRNADTFMLKILTAQQTNQNCTQAIVLFEEVIALDVEGLKAGVYTVNVNGVTDAFELGIDNVIRR